MCPSPDPVNTTPDALAVSPDNIGAWFAQQNRHDVHDWDSAAAPVIHDQHGRHLVALGSKDALLYLYNRDTQGLIARIALTRRLNDTTTPQPGKPLTSPLPPQLSLPGLSGVSTVLKDHIGRPVRAANAWT